MDPVNSTSARESYGAPSLTTVGTVTELTAGPVLGMSESPAGFKSGDDRKKRPQTEDVDRARVHKE